MVSPGATESDSIFNTDGDLLVAIAYGGQGNNSTSPNMTFAVSDTNNNTYYAGPLIEAPHGHGASVQIFFAPAVVGGPNTVTVTSASPVSGISLSTGLFLQEYAGLATTDVVDVASGQAAPSSSTLVYPGSVTTNSCDLVVAAFADGVVSEEDLDSGVGWRLTSTDNWDPGGAVDDGPNGAAAGTPVDAVMLLTNQPNDGWAATQLAFRAAGTSDPPQPSELAFASQPQTVAANTCSAAVKLQSQSGSVAVRTSTGISVALGGPFTFYADPGCAFPISALYIGAGMNQQSFYFEAASAGSPSISASASGLMGGLQAETIQ